jgi:uncharacterized protein
VRESSLRPDQIPQDSWDQVQARLDDVVADHDVTILWAIESGSRAWGFPSPDSDFDCRFVYVRPLFEQIRLDPHRDVIETPLTPILDVNGWDLSKALKLLLKGNAVILEWLASPIVYRGDEAFRDDVLALADQVADRCLIMRHYAHLCARQWERHGDGREVRLKKLFYALRPAMSLRWLAQNSGKAVPPMSFLDTIDQCDLPALLKVRIEELIAQKARTREMGEGKAPEELCRFIDEELEQALTSLKHSKPKLSPDRFELANHAFYRWSGLKKASSLR